jgi:heme-degrading monooxygenase HmoA
MSSEELLEKRSHQMTGAKVPTIDAQTEIATLINIYEVEPGKQAELVKFLSEGTDKMFRHLRGFVSVSIHSSVDGTRVVNYAQWRSKEDVHRVMKNPDAQALAKRAASIAKSVSPAVYQVASVHVE